jgi:sodium transport system permease protein
MYLVPLLGQNLGVIQVLRGQAVTGEQMALMMLSGFAAALLAVAVTAYLYRSERLAISG